MVLEAKILLVYCICISVVGVFMTVYDKCAAKRKKKKSTRTDSSCFGNIGCSTADVCNHAHHSAQNTAQKIHVGTACNHFGANRAFVYVVYLPAHAAVNISSYLFRLSVYRSRFFFLRLSESV